MTLAVTLVFGGAQFTSSTDSADPGGGVGNKPASIKGEVVSYDPGGGVGNRAGLVVNTYTL